MLLQVNDGPKDGFKSCNIALEGFMRLADDFKEMIYHLGFMYQQQMILYELCGKSLKG